VGIILVVCRRLFSLQEFATSLPFVCVLSHTHVKKPRFWFVLSPRQCATQCGIPEVSQHSIAFALKTANNFRKS